MNCDSCEVPKNSLIAATTGRMLIRVWGVIASTSWVVMRSRTTRSMRLRPMRTWFWISSPTLRMRRVAEGARAAGGGPGGCLARVGEDGAGGRPPAPAEHVLALVRQVEQRLADLVELVVQLELVGDLGDLGPELAVELVAADPRQVVAAVLEERVAEVGACGLDRRRLARASPLVDL